MQTKALPHFWRVEHLSSTICWQVMELQSVCEKSSSMRYFKVRVFRTSAANVSINCPLF